MFTEYKCIIRIIQNNIIITSQQIFTWNRTICACYFREKASLWGKRFSMENRILIYSTRILYRYDWELINIFHYYNVLKTSPVLWYYDNTWTQSGELGANFGEQIDGSMTVYYNYWIQLLLSIYVFVHCIYVCVWLINQLWLKVIYTYVLIKYCIYLCHFKK